MKTDKKGNIEKTYIREETFGIVISLAYKGGFAKVYKCLDTDDNKRYAVKCINKGFLRQNPKAEEKLHTEVEIHKSLDHPRIVNFKDFFEDDEHYYMVLELCSKDV